MAAECHVFIATSLNGCIARADGSIDWLDEANKKAVGDAGYNDFIETIDVIVMGSSTFKKVLSFKLEQWPYSKPVIVMSKSLSNDDVPSDLSGTKVTVSSLEPRDLVDTLKGKSVYVDGGKVIQSLNAHLISTITITVVPIVIKGTGIALFDNMSEDIHVELESSKMFEDVGFVQSRYRIVS